MEYYLNKKSYEDSVWIFRISIYAIILILLVVIIDNL